MRLKLLILALAYLGIADGQPLPLNTAEIATYETFFRVLVQLKHDSNDSVAVRDFIGLTDSETHALNNAAAAYVAKLDALPKHTRAALFESRLRDIESGRDFDSADEEWSESNKKQAQLLRDHMNQLKTALGESHFTLLDDYIHSGKVMKDLLPLLRQSGGVPVHTSVPVQKKL